MLDQRPDDPHRIFLDSNATNLSGTVDTDVGFYYLYFAQCAETPLPVSFHVYRENPSLSSCCTPS
jgi:hypothetical protein